MMTEALAKQILQGMAWEYIHAEDRGRRWVAENGCYPGRTPEESVLVHAASLRSAIFPKAEDPHIAFQEVMTLLKKGGLSPAAPSWST